MKKRKQHIFEKEAGISKGDLLIVPSHHGYVSYVRVENIAKDMDSNFTIWCDDGTGYTKKDFSKVGHVSDKEYEAVLLQAEELERNCESHE